MYYAVPSRDLSWPARLACQSRYQEARDIRDEINSQTDPFLIGKKKVQVKGGVLLSHKQNVKSWFALAYL